MNCRKMVGVTLAKGWPPIYNNISLVHMVSILTHMQPIWATFVCDNILDHVT